MSKSSSRWGFLVAVGVVGVLLCGCGDDGAPDASPRLAFVPNGADPFWDIARAGVMKAGKDFECQVEVKTPNGTEDQNRIIEDLITLGFEGIAISPIDGKNQTQLINEACKSRFVLTHDSDAPDSDRICYIGMDNYEAGRLCGQLVKEAIPDGGEVMIFVGRLSQANSRLRRQGVIDELLGRPNDPTRYDKPGSVPREGKYVVLGTRTDGFDNAKAKANAEDALSSNPGIAAMVGLFAYNPPMILEALRGADKLGKVKVIGFDEQDATLQGIKDGIVHGTVVQDPYLYGYESMRVLAALVRGDRSLIPDGGFMNINGRQIRKDTVDQFWTELKARLAAAKN
ncbi:MAG: sugar-binding protein [Planctomycetota bacterium]|nr:sugar-binding protein [Planctomycetota bacterium]